MEELKCTIDVARREDNHRLLRVKLGAKVEGSSAEPRLFQWNMD